MACDSRRSRSLLMTAVKTFFWLGCEVQTSSSCIQACVARPSHAFRLAGGGAVRRQLITWARAPATSAMLPHQTKYQHQQ